MVIRLEKPPNWEELNRAFELKKGVIFTWGDKIYNPDGGQISMTLLAHELVHSKQQEKYGLEMWWKRYLVDSAFRLSQEAPAHQIEYKEIKKVVKDRNKLSKIALELAKNLSGKLYGNMITEMEAYNAVRRERLFDFKV